MHTGPGIASILGGLALVLVAMFIVRPRAGTTVTDVLSALGGGLVGIGGLLVLHRDVTLVSWIVGPLLLALLAVAHVRALFAGSGPLRT